MADPWLKFYTSDWRADPRLKMCSPAARGMWIEMICLMHEASPYGHLLIHGQTPNEAQLASLTGISAAELPHLVAELERLGVFSRTKEGVIYSRKLVRMASRSAVARKNGKKGGRPNLGKGEDNSDQLNLQDKGVDKPQKPEARSQKKEERGKPLSRAIAKTEPERFEEFWAAYPHRGGVKRKRSDAEARYRRVVQSGTMEQDLIDAAMRHRSDRRVVDGFARDPTTWLNQRGWLDDIEPQKLTEIRGDQHGKPARGEARVNAFVAGARGAS
mgnify:FL=1